MGVLSWIGTVIVFVAAGAAFWFEWSDGEDVLR